MDPAGSSVRQSGGVASVGSWPALLGGLALALLAWALAFRAGRGRFWLWMTLGVGALGTYALGVQPGLRRERGRPRDLAAGAGSALALYAIFQIGDRLARALLPGGEREIRAIYGLRQTAPRPLIAAALALVIAPGEELFWRGLVQRTLQARLGRWRGAALASAIYGGIHALSGNLTLTGAASVAGAFWGLQYLAQERLAPLVASHVLWDLWIFLVRPTPGGVDPPARG